MSTWVKFHWAQCVQTINNEVLSTCVYFQLALSFIFKSTTKTPFSADLEQVNLQQGLSDQVAAILKPPSSWLVAAATSFSLLPFLSLVKFAMGHFSLEQINDGSNFELIKFTSGQNAIDQIYEWWIRQIEYWLNLWMVKVSADRIYILSNFRLVKFSWIFD